MRIISGEHRGRVLEAPEGRNTRPTTDRVRESIMSSVFSAMGGFEGLRVLDAFAGSGAMGLEAMSRGAEFVLLNDSGRDAQRILAKNRDSLGYGESRAKVTSFDAEKGGLPAAGAPYDIVFLDPPYVMDQESVLKAVADASDKGMFNDGALIVYEHDEPIDGSIVESLGLTVRQDKKIGKTFVTYITL